MFKSDVCSNMEFEDDTKVVQTDRQTDCLKDSQLTDSRWTSNTIDCYKAPDSTLNARHHKQTIPKLIDIFTTE